MLGDGVLWPNCEPQAPQAVGDLLFSRSDTDFLSVFEGLMFHRNRNQTNMLINFEFPNVP